MRGGLTPPPPRGLSRFFFGGGGGEGAPLRFLFFNKKTEKKHKGRWGRGGGGRPSSQPSVCPHVHFCPPSVGRSFPTSVRPCVCLSRRPSVPPPVSPSIRPHIRPAPPACPSVPTSVRPPVRVLLSPSVPVHPSPCPSVSPTRPSVPTSVRPSFPVLTSVRPVSPVRRPMSRLGGCINVFVTRFCPIALLPHRAPPRRAAAP